MANILARCHGVARRSPEAHRYTVAGIIVAVVTAAGIGVVAIGAAAIGVVIGVIISAPPVISSSFSAGLVFRSLDILIVTSRTITGTVTAMVTPTGMITTAGPLTDTVTAIRGTATAIKGTATAVVTAEGPRWGSCSAGWLGQDTITALLMESWDQKRDARFGRTNAATMTASTA